MKVDHPPSILALSLEELGFQQVATPRLEHATLSTRCPHSVSQTMQPGFNQEFVTTCCLYNSANHRSDLEMKDSHCSI